MAGFDENGNPEPARTILGGPLASPLGVAVAPAGFGSFAGDFSSAIQLCRKYDQRAFVGSIPIDPGMGDTAGGLRSLEFGTGGLNGSPNVLYSRTASSEGINGNGGSVRRGRGGGHRIPKAYYAAGRRLTLRAPANDRPPDALVAPSVSATPRRSADRLRWTVTRSREPEFDTSATIPTWHDPTGVGHLSANNLSAPLFWSGGAGRNRLFVVARVVSMSQSAKLVSVYLGLL